MPFPNYIGKKRYWTQERVLDALRSAASEIQGPLPCRDDAWNRRKKGRLDWPTSTRILFYHHSMARAWLAAGAAPSRVSLHNHDWRPEEDEYLLEWAGTRTLAAIARHLGRSYQAVRARLGKNHNTCSRHNQGFLSAAELAREYNCSCHRIREALRAGKIKGRFDRRRNRWDIDLLDVMSSASAQMILHRPKTTHKTGPTDLGDYYARKGLKRIVVGGKVVSVPKEKERVPA